MFRLRDNDTNAKREMAAGLTVFCTMVYVLAVNPAILAAAGMPKEALFTATAISAIVATVIMALWANLPFAVAPGMGINAFFAFVVVREMGYSWPQALTAVLISGLLFFIFSMTPWRERILVEVPSALKYAVCGGVGLMIAGIGLIHSGFIVSQDGAMTLAPLSNPASRLVLIGLFITVSLLALRFQYAILAGIILTTAIGIPLGVTDVSPIMSAGVFSSPPSLSPIALKFDFSILGSVDFFAVILAFLFIEIIDGLAGFLGLLSILGQSGERYRPLLNQAFKADSLGVALGSLLGMSPNTTYGESGVGLAAGGRTGLTALTVAALFGLALFCAPLFLAIPFAAVAPALIVVGWLMMGSLRHLDFSQADESLPAIMAVLLISISWRISDSLGLAWLAYILMKFLSRKTEALNPTVLVVGALFLLRFLFL